MKTGPGTPSCAKSKAFSTVGPMLWTFLIDTAHLVIDSINEIWSMSWSAPRPLSKVAAAPPKMRSGDCASWAFFTAVMVFVTPGPAVTAATPGTPVKRATASAAKTALTSSRTSTTWIPWASAPTRMGDMCPPHRVNSCFTPRDARIRPMIAPPSSAITYSQLPPARVARARNR